VAREERDELVLGLWDGHDAGAALAGPAGLLAAVSEERLSRVKKQGGWPRRSIEACLAAAGCAGAQVRRVVMAGTFGRAPARLLDGRYAAMPPQQIDPLAPSSQLFAAFQNRLARIPGLRDLERLASAALIRRRLAEQGLGHARLSFVDHHLAHATGAAAALGPGQALVVTMDGYGDGVSTAIWRADEGTLERLWRGGPESSVALLYGALTRVLGFREGEEGKLTGLAGLWRQPPALDLSAEIRVQQGVMRVDRRAALGRLRAALADGLDRVALAHSLQTALEEAVLAVVQHHLAATGSRRLAVAGGLFANVSLNGRLAELPVDEFAIVPAMGDQGLCLGAALHGAGATAVSAGLPAMDLGPRISGDAEVEPIADLLAAGAAVGVARGAMEFGPRALGRRSVLFDASRKDVARRVGMALGREPFMPFGPLLRVERWAEAFGSDRHKIARATREMTIALPARPEFAAAAPAAVHADGTARPQVVDHDDDPWLCRLLQAFETRSGVPALVNTSFNHHREPIVCDVRQAAAAAESAGLDAVVIGGELRVAAIWSERQT